MRYSRFLPQTWFGRCNIFITLLLAALFIAPLGIAIAQSEDGMAGEYTVAITREDLPLDLPNAFSYIGQWRIAFTDDGNYLAERLDTAVLVTGTWVADGNHLTLTDSAGLLSCSNAAAASISPGDISVGEYDWTRSGSQVTLVATNDGCGGRVLLLSTRPLETFVACSTTPEMVAAMAVSATPTAEAAATEAPSVLDLLKPGETAVPVASPTASTEVEAAIDNLLQQMTSCWATGDPDLWLPLLSSEFRATLFAGNEDFEATLKAAMASPIVWSRSGDIDVESETSVSTIVKTTTGPEEDFVRFSFVLEDGEWRWNG